MVRTTVRLIVIHELLDLCKITRTMKATPMTVTKSVSTLLVSVVQLLTCLVNLVCKVVRLLTTLALYATAAVERRNATPRVARAMAQCLVRPVATVVRTEVPETLPPVAPVAPTVPDFTAERLHAALTGLGFQAPQVRRYVASVKTRIGGHEPIETLIKDGLRALAS